MMDPGSLLLEVDGDFFLQHPRDGGSLLKSFGQMACGRYLMMLSFGDLTGYWGMTIWMIGNIMLLVT